MKDELTISINLKPMQLFGIALAIGIVIGLVLGITIF
jgi:ElaB/YqjD/DUF883 family membrane-anchored ribosome-binding protein